MRKALIVPLALVAVLFACCPPAPTITPTPTPFSACELEWAEAKYYVGERATVCGPVVDTHWAASSMGQPTFLNVGETYPSLNRFTVVIWIENRDNFPTAPESYYLGKNIAVTGLIDEYMDSAQMEVTHPSQIQVY